MTHGYFISALGCMFTNNIPNSKLFVTENNSMTIVDFNERQELNRPLYVDAKLTAFNFKIIERIKEE